MDRIAVCGTVDPGPIPGRRTMSEVDAGSILPENRHIANKWLQKGLVAWRNAGATVCFLEQGNLRIPFIKAEPIPGVRLKHTILAAAGLHMEETSGIIYLLDPRNFTELRKSGRGFLIFPAINQTGLMFPENSPESALRYDLSGKNYNDGWGRCASTYKPDETYLVEREIQRQAEERRINFCMSYHEDSELPATGYIYTKGIPTHDRKRIVTGIKSRIDSKLLANFPAQNNSLGLAIEGGMVVVDDDDPRAFEDWVYNDLEIPSVLVEGPFGCSLSRRVNFQRQVTDAVLSDE